jgi:hypothetical protein
VAAMARAPNRLLCETIARALEMIAGALKMVAEGLKEYASTL